MWDPEPELRRLGDPEPRPPEGSQDARWVPRCQDLCWSIHQPSVRVNPLVKPTHTEVGCENLESGKRSDIFMGGPFITGLQRVWRTRPV